MCLLPAKLCFPPPRAQAIVRNELAGGQEQSETALSVSKQPTRRAEEVQAGRTEVGGGLRCVCACVR